MVAPISALILGAGIAVVAPASADSSSNSPVSVYVTTRDLSKTMSHEADIKWTASSTSTATGIAVNPNNEGQKVVAGFGVALTDSSAYLISKLPPAKRAAVMKRLFSPSGSGIGLSFLRIPIGGSDYVVNDAYTYDDQPAGKVDPDLKGFSIKHDEAYVLPVIREALKLNPRMRVMANVWTQPAWMKTDGKLVTSTGPLGQIRPKYYGSYARYLVKFLQAYKRAGVNVDYLGIQNEPLTPLLLVAGIPETYVGPLAAANLVNQHVVPALRSANLNPTVMAYDDNYTHAAAYLGAFMPLAGKNVGGIAYHCYFGDPIVMALQAKLYPGKLRLETECSSKLSYVEPAQMMIRNLRNGAQGIQLWNAALDPNGGPKIGSGCKGVMPPFLGQDCIAPVTVDPVAKKATYTSDYWALAQFSKFIKQGATRIDSTNPSICPNAPIVGYNCGVETVAFKNPDGSTVLVVTSNDGQSHKLAVREGGKQFDYTLPADGTATFVWKRSA